MARDEKPKDQGKVRVRVIEFDMEGNNQTLRDSIRDIVGAIGKAPQIVRVNAPAQLPKANEAGEIVSEVVTTEEVLGTEEDNDLSDELGSVSTRRARSTPRTPELLDLNLRAGTPPLKEFLDKLTPESVIDRYVAIAYWLKNQLQIGEVTADHIHTGYRHMGWQTPTDAAQPLRSMKARSYQYVKAGSKSGAFVISHVGDNRVMALMTKAGMSA
jgi:hypothetical protein